MAYMSIVTQLISFGLLFMLYHGDIFMSLSFAEKT